MIIDPITEAEIQTISKWIIRQDIPTAGPSIAAHLLKISQLIREKAHNLPDEDVRALLNRYADYYQMVGMIEGTTAGGVIDLLREMIHKEEKQP